MARCPGGGVCQCDFARTRPYRRMAEPFDYVEAARAKARPSCRLSRADDPPGRRLHAIVRDGGLANTNGGTVYVGVNSNPKSPIRGWKSPKAIASARRNKRLVTPPLDINISVLKSHSKRRAHSRPKGRTSPTFSKAPNLSAAGSGNQPGNRDEIMALISMEQGSRACARVESQEGKAETAEEPTPAP